MTEFSKNFPELCFSYSKTTRTQSNSIFNIIEKRYFVIFLLLFLRNFLEFSNFYKKALGEGYHNFHHEFPQDYRNGTKIYHYDPTKWLIKGLSYFGMTYNLKMIPDMEIEKAKVQMEQRRFVFLKILISDSWNFYFKFF